MMNGMNVACRSSDNEEYLLNLVVSADLVASSGPLTAALMCD